FAATGAADAAIVSASLVRGPNAPPGTVIEIPTNLHKPIDHAVGVVAATANRAGADRFLALLCGPEGRAELERLGYEPTVQPDDPIGAPT
ncbi:MAG: substrate-binding domain-containing protein, partial [Planctomycetia bacterium]